MADVSANAAAYNRRLARSNDTIVRFEWFIQEVSNKIAMTLEQRVKMATEYLLSKVIRNISVPVVKQKGVRSGRIVVTERSKPGEFPRADTSRLMRDIFMDVKNDNDAVDGYVGTTVDYGVVLELQMNRSFLVRTLNEEQDAIRRILTGPIT